MSHQQHSDDQVFLVFEMIEHLSLIILTSFASFNRLAVCETYCPLSKYVTSQRSKVVLCLHLCAFMGVSSIQVL